ncbi:hypothetical protein [Pseudomonas sp. RIT-To-2]|uniref:hypothetical protein n=1 Tax=Pseudomonas sp. RIT-To-2 TaxID=3462541 RepID=UPI00241315B7
MARKILLLRFSKMQRTCAVQFVVIQKLCGEFLTIAGRSAGKVFCGVDIFYPRLLSLQFEADELLDELGLSDLLPTDAKVFCMHQGYEINYFLPISDDPPVFQFFEGQSSIAKTWDSFSSFLIASIGDHLLQWSDLN